MKKPVSPCKDCDRRTAGCHDECFDYIMYEIKQDIWREERFRDNISESKYIDHVTRSVKKTRRKHGRK